MKRYRPFVSLAGALLLGGLGFAGQAAVSQESDSGSAQNEPDSTQRDSEADRNDQSQDQQERTRSSAQRQRETRASRETEADTSREARRNEAANRFDEDPRERDRSYSRYSSDPTGRAEAGRSEERRGDSQGAWLGVFLAENNQQNGAFVRSVYPAGPAARAGFRPGDVIVSIDGEQVQDAAGLMQRIEQFEPRQQTQFVVLRNGQQVTLRTTLGDRQMVMYRNNDEDYSRRGEYSRENESDRASGRDSEDDEFASVPPYAMELEHHRRMAEQHQRLEDLITKLHEEVRQLRQELRTSQRQ